MFLVCNEMEINVFIGIFFMFIYVEEMFYKFCGTEIEIFNFFYKRLSYKG